MTKQTSKDQLLKDIHVERNRLEKLLSTLAKTDMEQTGMTGVWSVKDILAHLVAWERFLLDWYQTGLQNHSSIITPVGMSKKMIDNLNQEIYERNRDRPLDEILSEFHTSYDELLIVIEAISEDDMFEQSRFEWTGSLTLADYIAGNTCNHYAWAKSQIRKQVKRNTRPTPAPRDAPPAVRTGKPDR